MKGLSLYFLKNSMGANVKKSFRNTCNNEASTSTLPSNTGMEEEPPRKSVTLEEMILQLELEEELARRQRRQDNELMIAPRRMSCVNNSDILRSARNAALSQYPRFSLDGKDAMYRSSFRGAATATVAPPVGRRGVRSSGTNCVGGESVVWCSPGVVARLMGLEAMPVPVRRGAHKGPSPVVPRRRVKRSNLDHMMFVGSAACCNAPAASSSTSSSNTRRNAGCSVIRPVQARPSFSYMPTH